MPRSADPPMRWDLVTDVVVVGYGYAGAIAAIEATDAGCAVLILEKMRHPGGISICSGGGSRVAAAAEPAFRYLRATCQGTTPDPVLRVFAEGMTQIRDWMTELARINGAEILAIDYPGNYTFEGHRELGFVMYGQIPGFDPLAYYPHARGLRGGARHFKVLEDNVSARGIRRMLGTPVRRLVQAPDGAVIGVTAEHAGRPFSVRARKGVILACGGFEAADDLKQQYLQGTPILPAAFRGNTGDGIRMAQKAGAALWHMWHYHGTYGFRHTDPHYPFGIRPTRAPDWNAERPESAGMELGWIVVDKTGRRFMNEYPPYLHDTGHRALEIYDTVRLDYPRIPAVLIFDEEARKLHPMAIPSFNDESISYDWSEDNLKEIELGILQRADSVAAMSRALSMDEATLTATLSEWNAACDRGIDGAFGRPPRSLQPIRTPPFYFGHVWPVCSNTQGGPQHDEHWRVLDAFGEPIPRLYEAGELGGIFGFLYLAGGNLAECYIGGRRAARHAVQCESI